MVHYAHERAIEAGLYKADAGSPQKIMAPVKADDPENSMKTSER